MGVATIRLAAASALLLLLATAPATAQDQNNGNDNDDAIHTTGTIDAVTVYRGQAMVTRLVEVPAGEGLRRVVVESLPAAIESGSIYAESRGELTVRSVRYRTRPVREDVRQAVREIDKQFEQTQRQIEQVENQRATLDQQKSLVKALESFTAPSADWELSHGVLDAKALQSIAQFLFDQRQRINEKRLTLQFEKEDLEDELHQLSREREQLTQTSSKTMREAVVFLESTGEAGSFELRYLVNNASWSPSYNLRGPESRDAVQLEYLASIRQTSGEDWKDVKMTLSTASPSLVSEPPELASLSLTLSQRRSNQQAQVSAQKDANYAKEKQQLRQQQQELRRKRAQAGENAAGIGGGGGAGLFNDADKQGGFAPSRGEIAKGYDQTLNKLGAQEQMLDLVAGRAKRDAKAKAQDRRRAQQASVRYELSGRTSLPSRNDPQLVRIADKKIKADYFRVARPVLTEKVYEQAKLTNTMDWVLLAGPSNSYLAGQFVGRGQVPGVTVGESFKAGFGIDSSLRADRELHERDETTQGGNQVVRVTYRLSLANFAEGARTVRLFDRLPVPKRGEDVQIELVSTSEKPVVSPANDDGRITPTSDGIIRWDIKVPAGATGDDRVHVDYTFTMEYDRQKQINMQSNQP